jgi:hypothetical protein
LTVSLGVVLFPSVHFALQAEKALQGKGFSFRLVPVPRHVSSDCGVCLRISWPDTEEILELLKKAGVKIEGVHSLPEKE